MYQTILIYDPSLGVVVHAGGSHVMVTAVQIAGEASVFKS